MPYLQHFHRLQIQVLLFLGYDIGIYVFIYAYMFVYYSLEFYAQVLEDNLEWDDISWSQTGALICGREYHLARAHFVSQS